MKAKPYEAAAALEGRVALPPCQAMCQSFLAQNGGAAALCACAHWTPSCMTSQHDEGSPEPDAERGRYRNKHAKSLAQSLAFAWGSEIWYLEHCILPPQQSCHRPPAPYPHIEANICKPRKSRCCEIRSLLTMPSILARVWR